MEVRGFTQDTLRRDNTVELRTKVSLVVHPLGRVEYRGVLTDCLQQVERVILMALPAEMAVVEDDHPPPVYGE